MILMEECQLTYDRWSMKQKLSIFVITELLVITLIGAAGLWAYQRIPQSAAESLTQFYTAKDLAEDQIMDPLILAGDKVVAPLMNEVRKKDMPQRRYAIRALGNLRNPISMPALHAILDDPTEKDYFRCDALRAISLINIEYGIRAAQSYQTNTSSCLAKASEEVLSRQVSLDRNYLQALLSTHQ